MKNFIDAVLKHPIATAIVVGCITSGAVKVIKSVKSDNTVKSETN